MFFWVEEIPVTNTARYGRVIEKTCVDVYGWFRDVCSRRMINDGPINLGGRGVVVQVESCFSHKPKATKQLIIIIINLSLPNYVASLR